MDKYFYVIYYPGDPKHACKLGTTTRVLSQRLSEHQTSFAEYQYYGVIQVNSNISNEKLCDFEYICLESTKKWKSPNATPDNECRYGIFIGDIWQIITIAANKFFPNCHTAISDSQKIQELCKLQPLSKSNTEISVEKKGQFNQAVIDCIKYVTANIPALSQNTQQNDILIAISELSTSVKTLYKFCSDKFDALDNRDTVSYSENTHRTVEHPISEGTIVADARSDEEKTAVASILYEEYRNDDIPGEIVTYDKLSGLYPHQLQCYNNIVEHFKTKTECLVKMFCGTGKSHVIDAIIRKFSAPTKIVIAVFPTLALIEQYRQRYIDNTDISSRTLIVSSDKDSTTDKKTILHDLKNGCDIILVTYSSLKIVFDLIKSIDLVIFDEAHHITASGNSQLVFKDNCSKIAKKLFMTATPVSKNGTIMAYDPMCEDVKCGETIYTYSYFDGLQENKSYKPMVQLFDIYCSAYSAPLNDKITQMTKIYEIIINNAIETNNSNVLTFHNLVNSDSQPTKISVIDFSNQALLNQVFTRFQNKKFSKCSIFALHNETKQNERAQILDYMRTANINEIVIIASCKAISEGIDIRDANSCVLIDSKSSIVEITQILGRIVRKKGHDRPSSLILPLFIDPKRDTNSQLTTDDHIQISNVLEAIRTDSPELYMRIVKNIKSGVEGLNITPELKFSINSENIDAIVKDIKDKLISSNIDTISKTLEYKIALLEDFVILNKRKPMDKDNKKLANLYDYLASAYRHRRKCMADERNRKLFADFLAKYPFLPQLNTDAASTKGSIK